VSENGLYLIRCVCVVLACVCVGPCLAGLACSEERLAGCWCCY